MGTVEPRARQVSMFGFGKGFTGHRPDITDIYLILMELVPEGGFGGCCGYCSGIRTDNSRDGSPSQ
jgi:hypothetical protein